MNTASAAGAVVDNTIGASATSAAPRPRDQGTSEAASPAPARRKAGFHAPVFLTLVGIALYGGWRIRGAELLTAESGLGYALGIVGGVLMVLLLLYPLRKKTRFMRALGPVRHWFRAHMVFGIAGPVLILFHANFKLGSMNSSVALIAMLLVAGSGLIGRYFYSRIHHGLFGRRASLRDLEEETETDRTRLGTVFRYAPALRERLRTFEAEVLSRPPSVVHGMGRLFTTGVRTWWMRYALRAGLRRAFRVTARRAGWTADERRRQEKAARRYVSAYLAGVRKVAEFSFYERLFALWHVLHLPLFFMLLISGVVHVLAVHLY